MSISKMPNGRFRARLKSGRVGVASKVFDTRSDAKAWLDRERAALAGGVDLRAGRERVGPLVQRWFEVRRVTVAAKTYRADRDLPRLMPTSMLALQVSAVSGREVARSFEALLAAGVDEGSGVRYRASLSSFFSWCVREKLILTNPVTGCACRGSPTSPTRWIPSARPNSRRSTPSGTRRNPGSPTSSSSSRGPACGGRRLVRWVADVVEVPTPGLLVRRSQPEGGAVKSTKGRSSRRVALANPGASPRARHERRQVSRRSAPPDRARVAAAPLGRDAPPCSGPPPAGEGASTTSATPLRASGWPVASTPGPSRRGWDTSPSARRTATCTSSGPAPIWSASRGSM